MSTMLTGDARRMTVSRIGELADAQILYSSPTDLARSGRAPGMPAVLAGAWRERGFGDFWGYTLLAEGAAEAMVEVGLTRGTPPRRFLLVEEAGRPRHRLRGQSVVHGDELPRDERSLHELVRSMLGQPEGGSESAGASEP